MPELNRRFQLMMSEEQFQFLQDVSARRNQSMGDLIRTAIDRVYRPSVPVDVKRILSRLENDQFLAQDSQPGEGKDSIRSSGVYHGSENPGLENPGHLPGEDGSK